MSLGTLLTMVGVFGKMASDFGSFYKLALDFKQKIAALQKLTCDLNMETEVPFMKNINRQRRTLTKARRELSRRMTAQSGLELTRPDIDKMPLQVRNVTFSYGDQQPLFLKACASAHQSSLIAIAGDHGRGRQTFMRILATKLFPESGSVAIPTHLRILHVSPEPIILSLPAWENLTFACPDVDPERVFKVIDMMNMPNLRKAVEEDPRWQKSGMGGPRASICDASEHALQWSRSMSRSEQATVHLARAFIMNPEVMVIQHPFKHFDDSMDNKVRTLITSHIKERGIGMPPETLGRRRPRTVFFTADSNEQEVLADVIWTIEKVSDEHLSDGGSVRMKLPEHEEGRV